MGASWLEATRAAMRRPEEMRSRWRRSDAGSPSQSSQWQRMEREETGHGESRVKRQRGASEVDQRAGGGGVTA